MVFVLVTLVSTACTGSTAPTARAPESAARPSVAQAPEPPKTVSIGLRVEPTDMLSAPEDRGVIHKALFTATLANWDKR
jgi:hypothetical protein